jgi:hypothetical protein
MQSDHDPCRTCGARVRLEARTAADVPQPDGPVGPADGVVGTADPTPERRVCTNRECPTNRGNGEGEV